MRCPKCQYISFDNGDRCRNCGYEFSLSAVEDPPLDVTIGRDELPSGRRDGSVSPLDVPLSPDPERAPHRSSPAGSTRPLTVSDLPLFIERVADDQAPLVTSPAVPRPPLSVRRTSPRARPHEPEELSLDLADETIRAGAVAPADTDALDQGASAASGIVRRLGAGLIDVAVIGSIDVLVVYLTLRLCELTLDDWRVLPIVPLAAFLLLLSGGYFVLFTAAGGQTIGKMATGIRVVAFSPDDAGHLRVSFSTAMVRAVALIGSIAALGAGFLPVLYRPDRRAFHDRVAGTRVVSA